MRRRKPKQRVQTLPRSAGECVPKLRYAIRSYARQHVIMPEAPGVCLLCGEFVIT